MDAVAAAVIAVAASGVDRTAGDGDTVEAEDAAAAGPGFDSVALEKWLDKPGTHFFCDTYAAAGPVSEGFFRRPNVHSPGVSAGRTRQAFVLLSQKVLANIETALGE
ncbi:Uncharacterised protein [Faecalibacterium prausnitzii]|nr:Uncharacterised protein [Faecalibacterium prausnitzii]